MIDYKELYERILSNSVGWIRENVNGEDLNIQPPGESLPPLIISFALGYPENMIRVLVEKGADVNFTENYHRNTPLIIAAYHGLYGVVKLLLELGANPNKQNNIGTTPLMQAVKTSLGNRLEITELLAPVTNMNLKDVDGNTALILATKYNYDDATIVKTLLEFGADPLEKNDDGDYPLKYAVKHLQPETTSILKKYISEMWKGQTRTTLQIYKILPFFTIAEASQIFKFNIEDVSREYVRNPSTLTRYIHDRWSSSQENMTILSQYIVSGCTNLASIYDQIYEYDESEKRWCFNTEQFFDVCKGGKNPYTGKDVDKKWIEETCFENSEGEEECVLSTPSTTTTFPIEISDKAKKLLDRWTTEIYTFGQIFFSVPCSIQKEFAPTRPLNEMTLYRGMSFKTEEHLKEFLHYNSFSEDEYKLVSEYTTFSSWTIELDTATAFGKKLKYGIVVSVNVSPHDVLVDMNKIKYDAQYDEKEVIIFPGVYSLRVLDIFIPQSKS
jgi:hypothetical protein